MYSQPFLVSTLISLVFIFCHSSVRTGPPPTFASELQNDVIKIGDPLLLSCQGKPRIYSNQLQFYFSLPRRSCGTSVAKIDNVVQLRRKNRREFRQQVPANGGRSGRI